jgi:RNA polymerase sigma factor (sigma-70 family)
VTDQVDGTRLDVPTVQAARSGDRQALRALVEGYLPLVYSIVGRNLSAAADVDDVVQDTMIRVVRGIGGLRDPKRFRSWLVAITVNQIREYRRQWQTAEAPLDHYAEQADPNAEFVDRALTRLSAEQQRQEIDQAAHWLLPEDRELLSLWVLEQAGQLSRGDLTRALRLDAHHVAVRVNRLKKRLDDVRQLVRALTTQPPCAQLDKVAGEWEGEPSPLWRKRFSRHVGGCRRCRRASMDLLPADRVLALGSALLPLPAGYSSHLFTALRTASTTQVGAPARPYQPTGARRVLHLMSVKTGLVAAGVVVVCATGLAVFAPHLLPHTNPTSDSLPAPVTAPTPGGSPVTSTAAPTTTTVVPSTVSTTPPPATATPPPSPVTTHVAPPPPPPVHTSTVAPPASVTPAQQVLNLINQARAGAGLPAYRMDSGLVSSATTHNQTMAAGCGLSHQCPNEAPIGDRETSAGVHWTACGENIGDGGPIANNNSAIGQSAVGLTQAMLNEQPPDDGHRLNILSSTYTRVGIAVVRDSSGTVWLTQDFAN